MGLKIGSVKKNKNKNKNKISDTLPFTNSQELITDENKKTEMKNKIICISS